jgi:hypothetical protein
MLKSRDRGGFSHFNGSTRGKFLKQISRNIHLDINVFSSCGNAFHVA